MHRFKCVVLLLSSALTLLSEEKTSTHDVAACLQVDTAADFVVVGLSKLIASQIFERIGVRLRWSCDERAKNFILIRLGGNTPDQLHRKALAYARPYAKSGVRVVVFYDRFDSIILNRPVSASSILGYVFAHEIGHVLSGVAVHADRGLMKARWTGADFDSMAAQSLNFAPEDAEFIRKNIERDIPRAGAQSARVAVTTSSDLK